MIPVYYTPAVCPPRNIKLPSPSAQKPRTVVARWQKRFPGIEVRGFEPCTVDEVARAHSRKYVEGVLKGGLPTGMYVRHQRVAESCLHTCGAMLAAARGVLGEGPRDTSPRVAVAPVSGFHHAKWDEGGGFCTFNGLIVTARALLDEGRVKRVGILDYDEHYGDGTDDIIARCGLDDVVIHISAGKCDLAAQDALNFLRGVPADVNRLIDAGCDIILYQAGADPHIADPLGGFLTTAQLQARDRMVFLRTAVHNVPIVWNLAGGYQTDEQGTIAPVLAIHDNTMAACLENFEEPMRDVGFATQRNWLMALAAHGLDADAIVPVFSPPTVTQDDIRTELQLHPRAHGDLTLVFNETHSIARESTFDVSFSWALLRFIPGAALHTVATGAATTLDDAARSGLGALERTTKANAHG